MRIKITDRAPNRATSDRFLQGRYTVVSSGGLNPAERLLIPALASLKAPRRLLVMGNRTGAIALVARDLFPEAEVAMQFFDLFYAGKVRRNLQDNGDRRIDVRCSAFIDATALDAVVIQATRRGMSGELLSECLEAAQAALRVGGICLVAFDERFAWVNKTLTRLFGGFTAGAKAGKAWSVSMRKPAKPVSCKSHAASFRMTMQDRLPVDLISLPGTFSHRRVDQGAQALAEVAEVHEGDALLDMGCGCGAVGIAIAKNTKLSRVTFVDSSARAIHCTKEGCVANEIENAETILSANGIRGRGEFSVVVGNPPYFTDYQIAELFARTAYQCLRPGGRAYMVAKNTSWHEQFMADLFGNMQLVRRRGYGVVSAVRSPSARDGAQTPAPESSMPGDAPRDSDP